MRIRGHAALSNDADDSGESKYQIFPGSAALAVPPVEVGGRLFEHCVDQFSLIMMGFSQTGNKVISMTQAWCGMQAAVNDWVSKVPQGRPEWTFRNCNGMINLLAFALRDDIADQNAHKSLGALNVCKKLFLALGPVRRVESLVKDAWAVSVRGIDALKLTAADERSDEEKQRVIRASQNYASGLTGRIHGQRDAYKAVNKADLDVLSIA